MKKLLIPFLTLALYAETPKVAAPAPRVPELTDNEIATLYKALAEKTAAEVVAKEKGLSFADILKHLQEKCGGALVEVPVKILACAPPAQASIPSKDAAK